MGLRIAFTHEHCWPYVRRGGERYLHSLAGALARRGHDVTIFGGSPKRKRRDEETVRVYELPRAPASRPSAGHRFFTEVLVRLASSHFDVTHSLGPRDALAAIRARRLRSNCVTVYTNLGIPAKRWWDETPERGAHERVVADIDRYGCLSRYALEMLRNDYGRTGVLTTGGVSIETFAPVGPRAPDPTILYSSVLDEPRKGLLTLVDAMAILVRSEPRVRLWLSGPGDPTAALERAEPSVRDRIEVLPLGELADLPRRYSAAWVTALPSIGEAFGLVLVESLACGTPIVGTTEGALPELIRPEVGRAATYMDARSIANACLEAIGLARESDVRERCRAAATPYDWDASIAPAAEEIYSAGG